MKTSVTYSPYQARLQGITPHYYCKAMVTVAREKIKVLTLKHKKCMMMKALVLVLKTDDKQVKEIIEFEEHTNISNEEILIKRFNLRTDVIDYEILGITKACNEAFSKLCLKHIKLQNENIEFICRQLNQQILEGSVK